MKKLLATGLLLLAGFTAPLQYAAAQNNSTSSFKGGLMLSPSVCWMSASVDDSRVNTIQSAGAHLGFAYGLVGDFFFNSNYGLDLNPRINMFDEEFKYTPDNTKPYAIDRTVHLQYIDVPITLKMRTNEVGYMRYFAQIGFMPSVKISGKVDVTETPSAGNNVTGLNITSTNDLNLLTISSVLGLGAEYNLGGSTNLVGSITWNNGFTNIWNKALNQNTNIASENTNFNTPAQSIMLNVGIMF